VVVYTGGILGSDTEANVFITIYGKKGDTSRRTLIKSLNHDTKFQESQVTRLIYVRHHDRFGNVSQTKVGNTKRMSENLKLKIIFKLVAKFLLF